MTKGKVYLVGAGCGDTGLLTVKAMHLLRRCEVVLYDSLVQEELLQWVRKDCETIYVGKQCGSNAMKQQEINDLLVERASEGKCVVRLKGGDPYLFGRGGEEFLAVREAGIFCEEVPGITSAIAVPAAAGIPVTHRGVSSSVTVVTGTTVSSDGRAQICMDFETLAKLDGTLVILMGMHYIREIAEGLLQAGRHSKTPCAVIMNGNTRQQRCLRAVLSELADKASEQGFTSPAVIVIGAVAAMELLYTGTEHLTELPLSGITIGVTGTAHFTSKLSELLSDAGASVLDMGFMEVQPIQNQLPDFSDYGWLVCTSPNGARVFLDKCRQERRDLRSLCGKRIAVLGPGTASVFEEAGLFADYMPQVYDTSHLAQGLVDRILQEQWQTKSKQPCAAVFLRAQEGSSALPDKFIQCQIPFLEFPLYRLVVQEKKRQEVFKKTKNKLDYVVFGSAMGVRSYFEGMREAGLPFVSAVDNTKPHYICIGVQCGRELKKYTNTPALIAQEASVKGIMLCIMGQNREHSEPELPICPDRSKLP